MMCDDMEMSPRTTNVRGKNMKVQWILLAGGLALSLAGCEEDEPAPQCAEEGADRCLGVFTADEVTTDGDITTHTFVGTDGPTCIYGSDYRIFSRPGESDTLMFYLPSDGAALPGATPLLTSRGTAPPSPLLNGLLDNDPSDNPVTSDVDLVYISPCDGSLYAGDVEIEEDDGDIRYQRGLRNISAGIDIGQELFPNPERIVLAGSGGGSFGVLLVALTVLEAFPETDVYVIQDGAVGLAKGDIDDAFVPGVIEAWNIVPSLPEGCGLACFDNGHLTPIVRYMLDNYDNIRFAAFSSAQESVVRTFLDLIPPEISGEDYQGFVENELADLAEEYPGRYGYFVVNGNAASFTGLDGRFDYEVDGVSFGAWLASFLADDEGWASVTELDDEVIPDPI